MHSYAKTIFQPWPVNRLSGGCYPPQNPVISGNSGWYTSDECTGKKVANAFNFCSVMTSSGKRESDFPVSYKADEK